MKIQNALLAGCLAAVLTFSGCGEVQAAGDPQPARSAQPIQLVQENLKTISVSAKETVRVEPDIAQVVLAIESRAANPESCGEANTKAVEAVTQAITALGVKESSLQTSDLYLSAEYDWSKNTRTLTGYLMRTELTVSGLDIDLVGKVLSQAVSAGATDIRSISYQSSRYDDCYREALEKAVKAARKKAEVIAAAGEAKITGISRIDEGYTSDYQKYVPTSFNEALADSASGASAYQVQAGELEVSAQVTAEFVIE